MSLTKVQSAMMLDSPDGLVNMSITASVAASALTIALKDRAGSDCSATSQASISFRSATQGSGVFNVVNVSSAMSTVISSGSTAGFTSGVQGTIYVYALNNLGAVELAWSGILFDEAYLQSTTAEGGAGAADAAATLYSTTARSNVPIRLIGRLKATEATAGTWATNPSEIAMVPFTVGPQLLVGSVSNTTLTVSGTVYDSGSIVLTPGTWLVFGKAQASAAGSTQSLFEASLSLTTATIDDLYAVRDTSTQVTFQKRLALAPRIVVVPNGTTTTVYMCITATFTGTAPASATGSETLQAIKLSL